MIEEAHRHIEYEERGSGPTLVLVPGSCSTGAAWRPVMKVLDGSFRFVTTSLLGYGATAERRTESDSSVLREVEMLEAVVGRAGGQVHLVGHSFGGAVALIVATRKRVKIASLTVLEAPLPSLLRHCHEHAHYRAFRDMTDAYFAAYRGGDREAIRMMIDFYGGEGTYASWPEKVRAYAVETTLVNMLDWASAYDHPLAPETLAAIDVPVSVVVGGSSHPAICRANGLVSVSIEGATFKAIGGAAHFMISTHPGQVANLIADNVTRGQRRSPRPDTSGTT
ncbi:alpha/beta hydrolase [Mesorhizobium sp. LHD-90]|uniref:alpha/beta fold hydrolase n=1 Tax=Mesorhizobium sp. LHD-90 TaxID=3071414 RepID=UPI0027E194B8|nr:alpha/beta hydrolase [Mesorhizobium sp. LHD-90]MDQ6434885.1 alpha/beta hydrolase [Mesorhizobium sp. LHD-90]